MALGITLVLLVGGYFAYRYIVETPPDFLIKFITQQKPAPALPAGDEAPLTVPEGFSATIFARDIPGARVLTRDNKGVMLASLMKEGRVVALPDEDGNGVADRTVDVLKNLNQPHGLLVKCESEHSCTLYVAETDKLNAYAYDAANFKATFQKTIVYFPSDGGHSTRTLIEHPDGRILVSIGSSCNTCEEKTPLRASVQVVDVTTGKLKTFASGLRNSVFMATNPIDGNIWASENGRDLIGDNIPPDEINILKEGKNYGWPICYGKQVHDTDFDKKQYIRNPCEDTEASYLDLQAHSAALGLAFVPEEGWPDGWGNDLFVAFHGSWNRSEPTGYKVVRIDLDNKSAPLGTSDFVTGFITLGMKADEAIGRPVGILAEPGGTAYISDDKAGAIYKISLKEPAR